MPTPTRAKPTKSAIAGYRCLSSPCQPLQPCRLTLPWEGLDASTWISLSQQAAVCVRLGLLRWRLRWGPGSLPCVDYQGTSDNLVFEISRYRYPCR